MVTNIQEGERVFEREICVVKKGGKGIISLVIQVATGREIKERIYE